MVELRGLPLGEPRIIIIMDRVDMDMDMDIIMARTLGRGRGRGRGERGVRMRMRRCRRLRKLGRSEEIPRMIYREFLGHTRGIDCDGVWDNGRHVVYDGTWLGK